MEENFNYKFLRFDPNDPKPFIFNIISDKNRSS